MDTGKTISLLFLVILLQIMHCANMMAGGGSGAGNSAVVGKIYTETGAPSSNAVVKVIPEKYNPVTDSSLPDELCDTTDASGAYRVDVTETGIYNVLAVNETATAMSLGKDISVAEDTLVTINQYLADPGALQVILPDTMDTVNGYIYIEGTGIYRELANANIYSDSTISIMLSSVPAGPLPEVIYREKDAGNISLLISDTVIVLSNDTVIIELPDTTTKPVWQFPSVVGFSQNLADHFGGFDIIKDSIIKQFTDANTAFNAPNVFNGTFRFAPDSFYIISGAINDEAIAPPSGYALRVIYDGLQEGSLGANSYTNQWVCHRYDVNGSGGMFGEQAQNLLNWLFGLLRGCKPLDDVKVLPQNNPLNGQGFDPVASIMSNPNEAGPWDTYNTHVINYNSDKFSVLPHIKYTAFPASMGIYVESNGGLPVENAAVKLYGVIIDVGYVDSSDVILSGQTDINGEFEFSKNPYLNNANDRFDYDNILASAVNGTDTAWAWMPFYDASNAWFADPDTVFRTTITMP